MENKIYTEKTRKLRQNTQKISNFLRYYGKIHSKLPIFRVKSVKNYTSQKKFTRARDKYEVCVLHYKVSTNASHYKVGTNLLPYKVGTNVLHNKAVGTNVLHHKVGTNILYFKVRHKPIACIGSNTRLIMQYMSVNLW